MARSKRASREFWNIRHRYAWDLVPWGQACLYAVLERAKPNDVEAIIDWWWQAKHEQHVNQHVTYSFYN